MNNFFALFLILLLFYSCKPKVNIEIDNPSDKKIVVQFDKDEEVVLLPAEYKIVTITSGKRTIYVDGEKVGLFEFRKFPYFVNPLKAKYYIETQQYSASAGNGINENLPTSKVGDFEVNGDFELVDQLVIPKSWNIGMGEPFPPAVRTNSNSAEGKKLWRSKDLEAVIFEGVKEQVKEILKLE